MMAAAPKPLVLISATPIYGHLMPIRAIAKGKLPSIHYAPRFDLY